jgi:RNA polymerase sigma factor (sigma-70 family)
MPVDSQSHSNEAALLVRRALDQHEGHLIAYTANVLNGDVERAREVVQDALLKLYLTPAEKVRDNLKSWLFTVCRNRALDVLRKESRLDIGNEVAIGLAQDHGQDPVQRKMTSEMYEHVWRFVDQLKTNQQEVIRLKFQHDCSYQQISEITGLSVTNIGFIMHMGIKRLRELMRTDFTHQHSPHSA